MDGEILVTGIDQDEESRSVPVAGEAPGALARRLRDAGWRHATLTRDGHVVGRVWCSAEGRTWWAEDEQEAS